MSKRTILIFSILVGYVVMQFLWWEILLVRQSDENISNKQKLAALSSSDDKIIRRDIAELEHKKNIRMYMIVGEGSVFLLILLFGIQQVRKSALKETALNNQQKNFILSVSHELKTPIAAAKLQIQTLLKRELEKDQQKQLLQNALAETDRLHKLVENILLINQIENQNFALHRESTNLSSLILQITERYFPTELEKGIIKLYLEPSIKSDIDPVLFPSVIINLVENAVKYSFNEIAIEISLKSVTGKPVLDIADQGCGISNQEKEKIFNKFFRSGNEDTRKTKGTGIGLYIVKLVCDLHQFKIKVLDNKPTGSRFQITLN